MKPSNKILSTPVYKTNTPTSRRNSKDFIDNNLSLHNKTNIYKTKEDLNIRIVQLEINEKEACDVLTNLCQEAALTLGVSHNVEYRADDLLSGLLIIQNMYKRINTEKNNLEENKKFIEEKYQSTLYEKNLSIEKLEIFIEKLQNDIIKLQTQLTESELKHNTKIMRLIQEVNELKDNIQTILKDKEYLEVKIEKQDRKLLQMPRIEEQAIRNAKGIVRQVEAANIQKEIEWKKVEDDMKSLIFWKNKSKTLDDLVNKQKVDIDYLTKENRLSIGRYQNLLTSFHALKKLNPHTNINIKTQHLKRPSTANSYTTSIDINNNSYNKTNDNNNITFDNNEKSNHDIKLRPVSAPSKINLSTTTTTNNNNNVNNNISTINIDNFNNSKNINNKYLQEIKELKTIISNKDEKIQLLFQKLSFARAYPLQSLDDGKYQYQDSYDEHYKQLNKNKSNNTINNYDYPSDIETNSFIEEEKFHHQKRVDEALLIQQHYHERSKLIRSNNSPHIAAIRKSKSFARK